MRWLPCHGFHHSRIRWQRRSPQLGDCGATAGCIAINFKVYASRLRGIISNSLYGCIALNSGLHHGYNLFTFAGCANGYNPSDAPFLSGCLIELLRKSCHVEHGRRLDYDFGSKIEHPRQERPYVGAAIGYAGETSARVARAAPGR